MKYAELPKGHDWDYNYRHMNGFKASTCIKCKQLLYFVVDENCWYMEDKKSKIIHKTYFPIINRELEIIDCELMQNQIRMDEALS